ncbi:HAMP domain-containing sensor histidine kinase [Glaciihabitans sp. UYNi722]|uniref:sensor histidine kinase n=1 Tax=Glaciihabitans sp. UYNi722 TaxID=3156344 RepID=UPI003393D3A3
MTRTDNSLRADDSDLRAIRRASRAVGLQITIASSVLVIAVLIAAFAFVFSHIKPGRLFSPVGSHETSIDVGGLEILVGGLVIGTIAIILAGTMSWFATRRAVRPLGDALRLQRAFVADASHELRTPLTVLDARLQLLQRGLADDDPSTVTVNELRGDTKTLIGIVNDLLALAEVDRPPASSEPIVVAPVVQRAVDSMRILALERSVFIRLEAEEQVATVVPAASLHRCVVALLDNALDFSPPESTIEISVEELKSSVIVRVRDHGPGITGIEPTRIFDRFARSGDAVGGGGTSRTGFGIGLSLVRDTVERFGGLATVFATSPAGTTIQLLIPSIREPQPQSSSQPQSPRSR